MPLSVAFAVNFITIVMGLVLAGLMIFSALASVKENEPRAARRAILPGSCSRYRSYWPTWPAFFFNNAQAA